MNKRFTIIMLLMALFVSWAAKAQETKTIQVTPDRGGDRGTMTVYKRVSSPSSGSNYLIVNSATANSDALALSQVSSTASTITASFVHINSGISATSNAAYIADVAEPTAVWRATSGWNFSHSKSGTTYYINGSGNILSGYTLSASTSSTNWTYSNNSLSCECGTLFTTTCYITPGTSGFSLGTSSANVYLFEETSITTYNVTASVSPSRIGRVTGAGQYPAGATCTLTASATNSEYAFSNWTVNGIVVSTNHAYSFTVSEDIEVVANFESTASCPSPTNVTITDETAHGATISWDGTSDSYRVMVSETEQSITYSYDFEDGWQGWTTFQGNTTSPHSWMHNTEYTGYDSNGNQIVPECHNSTSGMMLSESYISATTSGGSDAHAVTPDNYLVSPQIRLGGSITFYAASRMSNYPAEKFSVMVSESGNTSASDFTYTELTVTLSDNSWHEYTVDLSAYSGLGYVAIRHYDCTDQHLLYIDDITIESGPTSTSWMTYDVNASPFVLYDAANIHLESTYSVQVKGFCGDEESNLSPIVSFTTTMACPAPTNVTASNETGHGATIAWTGYSDSYLVMVAEAETSSVTTYDFEDGTTQGWTILKGNTGDSPNNWHHSTTHVSYDGNTGNIQDWSSFGHNSSSGFMISESYISATSSGGTAYGAVTPDNYLVSPQVRLGGSISFFAGARNTSYCAEKFSVMVSTTDNTNTESFTTVETWILSLSENGFNPTPYTVDLSAYAGQTGYIAIRHWDCYDQWVLCIDDITIESGSTETSWMTYEAEESPFVLYDAVNIHPESTYNVQVIGICGDEESHPSATTSFTTIIACPAPTNLAVVENSVTGHGATVTWNGSSESYIVSYRISAGTNVLFEESFENENSLTNWTFTSMNTANNIASGYAGRNANAAHSGSYGFRFSSYSSADDYNQYLVSPRLTVSGDLKFYYKKYNTNDTESLKVGYSTTTDDIDAFTWTSLSLTTDWQTYTHEIAENVKYIAFHYYGDYAYYVYVDDFTISELVPAGEWQTVTADSTSITLTGLAPETLYEVVVQGDCGEEGISAESEPVTFTTDISCPAPTPLDATEVTSNSAVLNWTGDAESYNVSYYKTFFFENFESDEDFHSLWTVYHQGDPESWVWEIENPHDNSADLSAHSGSFAAVAYSDQNIHADNWLVSPQIQFPNQTTLKFWVSRSTYDDAQDEYEVLLSTTGNAIEDFDIVLKEKAAASSTWTEVSIDLSEYDGQLCYIAIRHDFTDGFFIMVDDFGIFGWSEEITTTDNSLLIEDLLPETEYQWKVQANCGEVDGLSQWSNIGNFTTLRACPVPFDLSATQETAYGATIAWTGYSESYNVWVGQYEMSTTNYDFEDQNISDFTTTTTDYPWTVTSNDKHSGSYSVKSGGAGVNSATSDLNLEVTIEHDATLSFWARISSESSYDKGYFSIDGVNQSSLNGISGNGSWINYTYTLEAGSHTLRWYYTKDTSVNTNDDCFYVDDITIESNVLLSEMNYTATESPFILNDESYILPETTYLVKVKGICEDEETEYSEAIAFTTLDENTKIFVIEGEWSNGDNWVPVGVPTIDENVILRAEATVFDVAEANNITIEGNATLTIEDGGQLKTNSDVTATMKKFVIGYGTDYVGTNNGYNLMTLPIAVPVSAADAGLLTEESDYDLYSWDRTATDEEWQNNHDGIDLQNGVGFLYANRDDMEMLFTATLRNSSEPVVVTPSYDEVEHGGWNLCGNPFPCEAYITTDAEGMAFYRLVDNQLELIEGAIAPLEAFFVNATAAGQTFTISREAPRE